MLRGGWQEASVGSVELSVHLPFVVVYTVPSPSSSSSSTPASLPQNLHLSLPPSLTPSFQLLPVATPSIAMSFPDPSGHPSLSRPPFVQRDSGDYNLNGKIIIAALVVLFIIVLLILALHIFAKWCWSRRSRRRRLWWRWSLEQGTLAGETPPHPPTLGLKRAIVESLPTFVYKTVPSQKDRLECAVCLSEFEENEKGRLLPKCTHSFHTECIDMWFLSHTTCPLCRTTVDPSVPASTENIACAETSSSTLVLLPENATRGSDDIHPDSVERAAHPQAEPLSLTRPDQPLPYAVWRWRRSVSDRFPYAQGVHFPTNILFWGNHSHISSRISSPRLEPGQIGGRSLPHTRIEITVSRDNLQIPPSTSSSRPRESFTVGQYPSCSSEKQRWKSTVAYLHAFSRLLSNKEQKLSLEEQDVNNSGGHS